MDVVGKKAGGGLEAGSHWFREQIWLSLIGLKLEAVAKKKKKKELPVSD